MEQFNAYHAHIYFDESSYAEAESLVLKASEALKVKAGRLHQKPVGPHPTGSCQVSFSGNQFAEVVQWLNYHRDNLDVLIHPVTGDDLKDHRDYVMWLGKSYEIDLSIFIKRQKQSNPASQ